MKIVRIIKKIDCTGRISIPLEIKRMLNIKDDDLLEVLLRENGTIVLQKHISGTMGIVRRVNYLGRVTIPVIFRRELGLKEKEPVEISAREDGIIIIRKYELKEDLELIKQYSKFLAGITRFATCITNTKEIIASSDDGNENYLEGIISEQVLDIIKTGKIWYTDTCVRSIYKNRDFLPILQGENEDKYTVQIVAPIIKCQKVIGSLILYSYDAGPEVTDFMYRIANLATKDLSDKMGN